MNNKHTFHDIGFTMTGSFIPKLIPPTRDIVKNVFVYVDIYDRDDGTSWMTLLLAYKRDDKLVLVNTKYVEYYTNIQGIFDHDLRMLGCEDVLDSLTMVYNGYQSVNFKTMRGVIQLDFKKITTGYMNWSQIGGTEFGYIDEHMEHVSDHVILHPRLDDSDFRLQLYRGWNQQTLHKTVMEEPFYDYIVFILACKQ